MDSIVVRIWSYFTSRGGKSESGVKRLADTLLSEIAVLSLRLVRHVLR